MSNLRGMPIARADWERSLRESHLDDDKEMAKLLDARRVCILRNGGVLVIWENDRCLMWSSVQQLRDYVATTYSVSLSERRERQLPSGFVFLRDRRAVVLRAAALLEFDVKMLDGSLTSVDVFDRAVVENGLIWAARPEVFEVIVGYVGEVIRCAVSGEWMEGESDGQTIAEPQIVDGSGQRYFPVRIVNELQNGDEGYSLSVGIRVELGG